VNALTRRLSYKCPRPNTKAAEKNVQESNLDADKVY
jgi:hypothetical protein